VGGYSGRFEHQLDEKGRVSLPAPLRKGVPEDASFVLLQWEQPYLTLFPPETWARVVEELREFRRTGPEAIALVRRVMAGVTEVAPDRQGRILIPGWQKELGSLEGTVLLIGNIDRVELWNPELYREAEGKTEGDFESFRHRIFVV